MKALHLRWRSDARSRVKPIFLTAEQLEQRASARIEEAQRLPPGEARQHALKNAAQLRSYAAMKTLLAPAQSGPDDKQKEVSDVSD